MTGPSPSTTLDPIARISAYGPWLIVSVALRLALTYPWDPAAWVEVRQHIPWLLAEQTRIRKAGWFN
jgi:acetyl esterase/lipase